MRLRVPPGRTGRLWLRRRLDLAERGVGLLDRKLRILRQEEERLRLLDEHARRSWHAAFDEARTWALRAVALAGERAVPAAPPAEITIDWAETMGTTYPGGGSCWFPDLPGTLPRTAAAPLARAACRTAVDAAVRHATAHEALRVISAEAATTTTRIRALRERWIPALERALAELELELDELERTAAVQAGRSALMRRTNMTIQAEAGKQDQN